MRGSYVDSESQTMQYVPRYGSMEVVYMRFCGRRRVSCFLSQWVQTTYHLCED